MNIRILLIDGHPVVRTGLYAVLEAESDLAVVGEADNGTRAWRTSSDRTSC
jgi:DNA-binding NarL/FixJ family response regulator